MHASSSCSINCSKEDCHLCYYFKMNSNISVGDPAFSYSCSSISQYHNSKASKNSGLKTVEKNSTICSESNFRSHGDFFVNEWVYMNTMATSSILNTIRRMTTSLMQLNTIRRMTIASTVIHSLVFKT